MYTSIVLIKKFDFLKMKYPHIRISSDTHSFLKEECFRLDVPSMTEFIELLIEIYRENEDTLHGLSGGAVGRQKGMDLRVTAEKSDR